MSITGDDNHTSVSGTAGHIKWHVEPWALVRDQQWPGTPLRQARRALCEGSSFVLKPWLTWSGRAPFDAEVQWWHADLRAAFSNKSWCLDAVRAGAVRNLTGYYFNPNQRLLID